MAPWRNRVSFLEIWRRTDEKSEPGPSTNSPPNCEMFPCLPIKLGVCTAVFASNEYLVVNLDKAVMATYPDT